MTVRDRESLVKAWNEGQRPKFLMFWGRKGPQEISVILSREGATIVPKEGN